MRGNPSADNELAVGFPRPLLPNREGQETKDDETLKAMSPLKLVQVLKPNARNPCQLWKQSLV